MLNNTQFYKNMQTHAPKLVNMQNKFHINIQAVIQNKF